MVTSSVTSYKHFHVIVIILTTGNNKLHRCSEQKKNVNLLRRIQTHNFKLCLVILALNYCLSNESSLRNLLWAAEVLVWF